MVFKKAYILIISLLYCLLVFSQNRPKVGLVLSGGGAKGFAHVGVLKEIERSGIKIDYIGGTSMGAIIGGLYASGYSADAIEQQIKVSDFNNLLVDKIPRADIPLFNKKFQEKFVLSLPITKDGISAKAVSKGFTVSNYYTQLFSIVDEIHDFSKLPIPFFCIGTDIINGKKVVFEKGSLAISVLASSAFPTLLDPVKIDGKTYIDGGVMDNFPVKEMRKKGVDIVIGVDLQKGLKASEKMSTFFGILSQIINIQMYDTTNSQKPYTDIYIKPDVTDYSVVSFEASDTIIKKGEKAAKKFRKQFDSIAKLQGETKKVNKKKFNFDKKFIVSDINIFGNNDYNASYILSKLQLRQCDSVNHKDLTKKMNRLMATKNFAKVDFSLHKSEDGKNLSLQVKESKEKQFLKFGVHYDNLFGLGLLSNYTHKHLLTDNDILSFDFVLGDKIRYDLNYFIDNGYSLGAGFRSRYHTFDSNIDYLIGKINKINVRYSELINRFYVQTKFKNKYAVDIGCDIRSIQAKSETFLVDGKPVNLELSNYILGFANLAVDNFDKKVYPKSGIRADVTFDWVFYSDRNNNGDVEAVVENDKYKPFKQLYGTFATVSTLFDKLSIQQNYDIGFTFSNIPTDAFAYKIGGYNKNLPNTFFSFYGWNVADYIRNNFVKAAYEVRGNYYNKQYLLFDFNVIKLAQSNFFTDKILEGLHLGYAGGLGIETAVGEIELRYSWSKKNKSTLLFNLGFWF